MGGDGKNMIEMPNITALSQAKMLTIKDIRLVGCDIRVTAELTK
jgi:diaminohydroxyphosphoribosylaminopyrimidine deaminase/5-amino-6-(5-phosphoribosylamino)uracil reductase